MGDPQRDQQDAVAIRSKIYGHFLTEQRHVSRTTSEPYAATSKRRHNNHSASFLPQVVPAALNGQRSLTHKNHRRPRLQEVETSHAHSSHNDDEGDSDNDGDGGEHPSASTTEAAGTFSEQCPDKARSEAHSTHNKIGVSVHYSSPGDLLFGGCANTAIVTTLPHGNGSVTYFSKALLTSQQQVIAEAAHNERLRTLLKEKDLDITRIKHENVLLRQIERRHQKEIEQFEAEALDAPRVIRGMREELASLKHKLKVYFSQIGEDSRQLRHSDDEKRRLRDHNFRLEKLIASKDLADRDMLNSQLQEANQKIEELDRSNSEVVKRFEVSEKNLSNDNRQLRGKIHSLDRESMLIHDRIKVLEKTLHDKDMTIASLSIYRYNIVHRKNDAICKVCLKREKQENESRRKQKIRSELPEAIAPTVSVISDTSVKVQLTVPPPKSPESLMSQLFLYYSNNPEMGVDAKCKTIEVNSNGEINEQSRVFTITELEKGTQYYFQVTTGHQDVESDPSDPTIVLVDAIPNPPIAISASVILSPPAIRVMFKPNPESVGSPVLRYRLFTSTTPEFLQQFLVVETETADLIKDHGDWDAVTYYDPQISVPLYFKIAAVNIMGEGQLSESSTEIILDFPPNKPLNPVIKRITSSSVQIESYVQPNKGTPVQSFLVVIVKVKPQDAIATTVGNVEADSYYDRKEVIVPATHTHPYDLVHTIEGLERDTIYKFSVQANNQGGDSPFSDFSENVDIDALVPAPGDIHVHVLTSTSVKVDFPSMAYVDRQKSIGLKIVWALDSHMHNLVGSTNMISLDKSDHVIEDLNEGQCLYFAICLVGVHEEGVYSKSVFTPLAAGIVLPLSPFPTRVPNEVDALEAASSDVDLSGPVNGLSYSVSKGSTLSISQRVVNMHHGMPAYHDPPVDEAVITPRTSMSLLARQPQDHRTHRSTEDLNRDIVGRRTGGSIRSQRLPPSLASSKSKLSQSIGNLNASHFPEKGSKPSLLLRSSTNILSKSQLPQ
ncbi:hypothetical protein BASA83_005375 [Batrachochytrium salamandrivorans]|nr:hypothetical protein BASA83_005375 [Batrachochytrium salamandrivorans]